MPFQYTDFDSRYRISAGALKNAGAYAIFSSQIVPSSLMIIGHNPGGDPAKCVAQISAITEGFHDYVNNVTGPNAEPYKLATVMNKYLTRMLELDDDEALRQIPKINVVFRRSENESTFGQHHANLSMKEAAEHDKEFVEEIIRYVNPKGIVFEGHGAWEKFRELYCDPLTSADECVIRAGRNVRLVRLANPFVTCLGRQVAAVILAHPSQYGSWRAIERADEQVRSHLLASSVAV